MLLASTTYLQVRQFDKTHLIAMLICCMCFFLIPYFGKKLSDKNRKLGSLALVVIGILQEIADYSNRIYFSELNLYEDLPLHICNYVFYIGLIYMWTKKQFLFEIIYLVGLGAGRQSRRCI